MDKYETFRLQAFNFARRRNFGDEAEDFAQACLIRMFQRGGEYVNLDWEYTNFTRQFKQNKNRLSSSGMAFCSKVGMDDVNDILVARTLSDERESFEVPVDEIRAVIGGASPLAQAWAMSCYLRFIECI
jgi:hypothetical protein